MSGTTFTFLFSTTKDNIQKKRGTEMPLLLVEVVRVPSMEENSKQSTLKQREPLHYLAIVRSFSHFYQQDEHNASCFLMSAAQRPPKNCGKDSTFLEKQADVWEKMYLCSQKRVYGYG